MEDKRDVFKLSFLKKLYCERLEQLGHPYTAELHSTRFKEHLLKLMPSWSIHSEGRQIFFSHKKTISAALAKEAETAEIGDNDARKIIEVGLMMRKYTLKKQGPFTGTFSAKCLSESVAYPLLVLVDTMLEGTTAIQREECTDQSDADITARLKVAYTLSQLICSKLVKRTAASTSTLVCQCRERQAPFPLYFGLKLHAEGHQKNLIKTFHNMGLCVSYDRIMEVRTELALSVSERYEADEVVIPSNMKFNVFTTVDVDNHDVTKSCNLSRDEFHGTSITMTNHLSKKNMGDERHAIRIDGDSNKKPKLPDHYTIVHPAEINNNDKYQLEPSMQGLAKIIYTVQK